MQVFVVQHVRGIDGASSDVKLVGVYASEEDANNAVVALTNQPGFGGHKDCFTVDPYELGSTHWRESFVATSHEPVADVSTALEDLTARFKALGAPDPEGWAGSQHREGIPQLHRFLFLRQAWKHIVSEGDTRWMDYWIAESKRRPDAPYAGLGAALAAAREKGVSDDQITDLADRCAIRPTASVIRLSAEPREIAVFLGFGFQIKTTLRGAVLLLSPLLLVIAKIVLLILLSARAGEQGR